jgi:EF hand
MKKLTLAAASALTLALAVPMIAQAGGHKGGKHFEQMDTNGDGTIARAEVEASAIESFGKSDANADGFLTQEELKAAHEAHRAEMKAEWAEKAEGKEPRTPKADMDPVKAEAWKAKKEERKAKMVEKSAERFAETDTDGDGRWNQAEYVTHRLEPFAKVDTDGDGNLSAAEQAAAKAKMKEKRGKWRDKPAEQ